MCALSASSTLQKAQQSWLVSGFSALGPFGQQIHRSKDRCRDFSCLCQSCLVRKVSYARQLLFQKSQCNRPDTWSRPLSYFSVRSERASRSVRGSLRVKEKDSKTTYRTESALKCLQRCLEANLRVSLFGSHSSTPPASPLLEGSNRTKGTTRNVGEPGGKRS